MLHHIRVNQSYGTRNAGETKIRQKGPLRVLINWKWDGVFLMNAVQVVP
jgi:hypothetical protein